MWSLLVGKFQKGACRYLLHRYLGQYLKEKVTVDQLTVDLYNGTGSVTDVSLDCDALNGLAEQHNLPIEFIEGSLAEISFHIPWSTIMQESCEIKIHGMKITIQPKNRSSDNNASSMIDSMFTSMASSMQLAEECLKKCEDIEDSESDLSNQEISGLEHCAKTIDAVLSRVKITFEDTLVRLEKCERGSDVGIATEFHINLWKYSDDSSRDERRAAEDQFESATAFSHKKITLEGITCHTDIFNSGEYFSRRNRVFMSQDEEDSDEEISKNSVQIGKFSGQHEIKLQVKMDDSMAGPQVSVDCNFGSLIALLTPIQAHILHTLVDELLNPIDSSGDAHIDRRLCSEKPMDSFDFKRVEEELQEGLKPGVIGRSVLTTQQQGWSSACYDDSDEEFLPLKSKSNMNAMYASSTSNFMNNSFASTQSSMHQSITDSISASTYKSTYTFNSQTNMHTQPSTEKTKFSLSFASCSVLLLHEDIMRLSATDGVVPTTLQEMLETSRAFFERLYYFGATVKGEKDVEEVREKMNAACDRSHHRLIAAPLKIKGSIQMVNNRTETNGSLALGYFELIECLKNSLESTSTPQPSCIEVLTFPRNFGNGNMQALKLDFKTESRKGRTSSMSKTQLKFHLNDCHAEFDISVIDRINSLINSPLSRYITPKDSARNQMFFNYHPVPKSQNVTKIFVKCSKLSLDFRFPIPDLRPIDDPNRLDYKIRNVQNDSILVQLAELDFSTMVGSAVQILEFDTKCHEAKLFYKTSPSDIPTLFATALADDMEIDGASMGGQGLDWPRILVWIYPKSDAIAEEVSDEGEALDTMNFMAIPSKKPSPFSSKRIVHEANSPEDESGSQGSESVIPGDRSEMGEFVDDTNRNVLYKVDLNLRVLEVAFPSKHIFEEVYNRVGNDLLLWEPAVILNTLDPAAKVFRKARNLAFSMCKSALRLDPDSDSEEEMSAFYTASAGPSSNLTVMQEERKSGQSDVTFSLTVGRGIASFYTPMQDPSGNFIPGQKGQMTIKVEQGSLFVVSGYKGDNNLGYLCLVAQKAELHHADFLRNGELLPKFCGQLMKTIFPSSEGMMPNRNVSSDSSVGDMLSVAMRIERNPMKHIKMFKVATGIRDGTLDHRMYQPNRTWFTQLTDFFDVTDTPIIGYTPCTVLTELHLHLWNCAINYKPLHLPLRCVLTLDSFSFSMNIAAATTKSTLRFMSEDACLFLSTKPNSENLSLDYVCIMEMDYFDASWRFCTNRSASSEPKIDLTASNNLLHIRTCSDSLKHFLELLSYFLNDGDLMDPSLLLQKDELSSCYSPIKESSSEPALITTEEILGGEGAEAARKMSQSQTEHVHDLVAEAMKDEHELQLQKNRSGRRNSSRKNSNSYTISSTTTKPTFDLHFSPEDGGREQILYPSFGFSEEESTASTPLPPYTEGDPVMESCNGFPIEINPSDEDEEEFCILENDPGVGILPKGGEPEARILSEEPIRLIENHFAPPVGKMDALQAPKHYPNPVYKYSLKEISIVWHLYGGNDFDLPMPQRNLSGGSATGKDKEERGSSETVYSDSWKEQNLHHQMYYESGEVDLAIDALNAGSGVFSKTKAFETVTQAWESPKAPRKVLPEGCTSWRHQGGKGRKHDTVIEFHLMKMKFVHETYPEAKEQASRQVLVINNVEILDKLRSSQFNKMMYLYTTPSKPRQTHANMVTIKAAHLRPDPQLAIEECCLKISLLPIRLNIDQDALIFIYQYFSELSFKSDSEDEESISGRLTNPPSHTPSVESLPVMTVNVGESGENSLNLIEGGGDDGSNLLMFNDDPYGMEDTASTCSKDPSIDSSKISSPIYFRKVIFSPEVLISLDYRGKHKVDTSLGPLAGLLLGLAQLNHAEIRLKQIVHRHGILGIDRLLAFLQNEWAQDISKNQLPSLLGGVGPIHSFVQLFQGVRDLFWLPIEQYQKDGRIAKGLQRGVNSFSTSTAMAALDLTNKFIQTIQGAAEFTYDMVSPGPSVQQKRRQTSSKRRKRYNQPGDIREGMTNAYNVVCEGLTDTAHTIVRVASKEHEQKGFPGAVGSVIRQVPSAIVQPLIVAAEASSLIVGGTMSQIKPEIKKENQEKWKELRN